MLPTSGSLSRVRMSLRGTAGSAVSLRSENFAVATTIVDVAGPVARRKECEVLNRVRMSAAVVLTASSLLVAACDNDSTAPSPSAAPAPAPGAAPAPGPAPAPAPAPATDPITVLDLVITPERSRVGNPATGRVVLSRAAEGTGQVVILSSSNTDMATVPASVTVPAGETSIAFDVKALGELGGGETITSNALVFIEAKINGVGRAAGFVVEPR